MACGSILSARAVDSSEIHAVRFNRVVGARRAGALKKLREHGEELAGLIDWEAILQGTDERFRVDRTQKLFPQYAKETAWSRP
jgi:hypothetical protein